MLRILSEFLWSLRRRDVAISVSETLDAAQAVALVGFSDRQVLHAALRATLVKSVDDTQVFDTTFSEFFAANAAHPSDLLGRLRQIGFSQLETDALAELLRALSLQSGAGDVGVLSALVAGESEVAALMRLFSVRRLVTAARTPGAAGAVSERVAKELGFGRAAAALDRIEQALAETMGVARAAELKRALQAELALQKRRLRQLLVLQSERSDAARPHVERLHTADRPFADLSAEDRASVERALRTLGQRLAAAHGPRARRARRGRIDGGRTLRAAMSTAGVPIRLWRRARSVRRPKLLVVCDISESVRHASRFMLLFVAAAQAMFEETRAFVFKSDLIEVSGLLRRESTDGAFAKLSSGTLIDVNQNSNYGLALGALEKRLRGKTCRRTVLVVLGDGRTNLGGDGSEALRRLKSQLRAILWLCPEDPARWGQGDSAMLRLRESATEALPVRSPRELADAVRRLRRLQG